MRAGALGPTTTMNSRADRDTRLRRALQISVVIAGLGTAVGALVWHDDPVLGSALGAGAGFLVGAVIGAFADWRVGLALLVILLIGEDSLRKAVPGSPYTISLAKDILIGVCYLSYALRPHLRRPLRPADNTEKYGIYLPIFAWMGYVVLQAANPSLPHFLVGISGIRTWLVYFPMMILMSNFFREPESARRFLRMLAWLAIPILVVAWLQNSFYYQMPAFLSDSAFRKTRFLESGGELRYNESIFASPTLLALVCVFQICLVIGLLKTERNRRHRFWLWIGGYCAVMSAHLSGVRTGLMFVGLAVLCALPLILNRHERAADGRVRFRPGLIGGGIVGLILGGILVGMMTGNRAEAFWTSLAPEIVEERMDFAITMTDEFGGGLMGNGTGSAGKSGRVMTLFGEPSPGNEAVEWGTALIHYSFGRVGMGIGAVLGLWAFFGLLRCALENRQARFAPLRYMLWIYLGAQLSWYLFKAYPVLENGTLTVMFWTSAGLIIGLRRLDEFEQKGHFAP